jgi:XRE family transcriptional regulator, aerobic/anaerobic benzoate catabolism transcriptional regulator
MNPERKNGAELNGHPKRVEERYLHILGENVRARRSQCGMTRKALAAASGVSERFLAQLEGGTGNASILVLRQIAEALGTSVERLLLAQDPSIQTSAGPASTNLEKVFDVLNRMSTTEITQVRDFILRADPNIRRNRIALIGLRGAGKSTVGALLAKELSVPFYELDRMIEQASGLSLNAIFDMYGQAGFRRFERQCLDRLLEEQQRFVLAASGGVVSEPETYDQLLRSCYTVWLKATPREHMDRVIAQGDMRPMAQNPEAMTDLERILREREHFYKRADVVVNTSGGTPERLAADIAKRVDRQDVLLHQSS